MKPVVQELGQQLTKPNLMAAYIRRVRSNIHTVLCMRLVIMIMGCCNDLFGVSDKHFRGMFVYI